MHEITIANKIIEEARKQGDVNFIELDVGEIAHLTGKELEEALRKVVDWKIKINEIKSLVECECGYKGKPKIIARGHDLLLFECPKCKSLPKVLKGEDIIIKRVGVK